MARRVKAAVLATLIAPSQIGAATAATPAAYRAKVNAICRGYTPTGKKLEAAMTTAEVVNRTTAPTAWRSASC